MMEYKETRRQENKTIVMQAQTVSSKSNVLYSRIPVFSSSKSSVSNVFQESKIVL